MQFFKRYAARGVLMVFGVIICLLMTSWFPTAHADESEVAARRAEDTKRPAASSASDRYATYVVDVYVAGHHFQFPRNYLTLWAKTPAGRANGLSAVVRVALPEFEPQTTANDPRFDSRADQTLELKLWHTRPPGGVPMSEEALRDQREDLHYDAAIAAAYKRQGVHSMEYVGSGIEYMVHLRADLDYFVTPDKTHVVQCIAIDEPIRRCAATLTIFDHAVMDMEFSAGRLNEFPQLLQGIDRFLKAHEVTAKGDAR